MGSNQAENRRAQTASEPDWSLGSGSSTTALPKYSDTEFSHLEGDVVQQMEEVFGPDAEAEEPKDAEPAADDSSLVSEGRVLLSRARTQMADAFRGSRESRDSDTE
jgi:hypothetical protein